MAIDAERQRSKARSARPPQARALASSAAAASKKRKAIAEPSQPLTPEADALAQLEAAISARRSALDADLARVPHMRSEACALRARADAVGNTRSGLRMAQDLRRQADGIDAHVGRIETGKERASFGTRAERYLALARLNAQRETETWDGGAKRVRSETPLSPSGTASCAAASNAALLREYRAEFERHPPPMHIVQHDTCPACAVPLLLAVNGSLLTCPECYAGYPYMDATTASMAYGDEVEFMSNNAKKAHHFEDRLKMFQGKGSRRVTKEVLAAVMEWHAEQGIASIDDITTTTVRRALKAKGFKDHYDYEMYIWCRITGKPAPTLGPTKESQCRYMFMRIQAPYAKWKARIDPTRINFLSYAYVLYKFFQLLGWDEYLPYFTLLKGRDKLDKQEAIWQGICEDVDWDFIPAPVGPPAPPRSSVSRAPKAARPAAPEPAAHVTPSMAAHPVRTASVLARARAAMLASRATATACHP